MNYSFKKMLTGSLLAGIMTVAGAAEKVWNFDSINDVAPPPWAPTGAPGFVDGGENITCADSNLGFTLKFETGGRCFFGLNFGETVLDSKEFYILTIKFHSPVSGRIQLFYSSPDGEMASMDSLIEVVEGWNEYTLDMKTMTFGSGYKNDKCKDKNYKRWGGEIEKVNGLRIDTWFPKGTTVKFDYIKLSDGKTNLQR